MRADEALQAIVDLRLAETATMAQLPTEGADRERVRLHPLVRAYAEELFALWNEAARGAASRALAEWYTGYLGGLPSVVIAADEANCVGALEWAHVHVHGEDKLIALLCDGLRAFWRDTGRTRVALTYLPWGVAAAEAIATRTGERGDQMRAANISVYYGDVLIGIGEVDAAEVAYQQDQRSGGRSMTTRARGRPFLASARSRWRGASWMRRRATSSRAWSSTGRCRIAGARGWTSSSLGQIAQRRGRLDAAEGYFQQSLGMRREVQDRQGEGVDLSSLAIAQRRGRLEEAEGYFQQSLGMRREVQDRQGEGVDLSYLGQIALRRGRLEEAEGYFQQSLVIRREVQDRRGEGVDLSSLGQIAQRRGRLDAAEGYFQQGLAILREVQDWPDVATLLGILGEFLITKRGKREEGCAMLEEAARLYEEMGVPGAEEARETAKRLGCG